MNEENDFEDLSPDEVFGETEEQDEFFYEAFLETADEFPEIPIFGQEAVVFPMENMTLEVTDPEAQEMFAEVFEGDGLVGIAYQPQGEQSRPPVGTLGVAVGIKEIIKTDFGKVHLVKIWGMTRFEIDGYVVSRKPVPIAKVSYFQDDARKDETPLVALKIDELRGLLRQWLALSNKPNKNLAKNLPDTVTVAEAEMYSFFFWRWTKLPPDVRQYFLGLRSTLKRLIALAFQFEVAIRELKDRYRAGNN
jgi:Lon protease-like protein